MVVIVQGSGTSISGRERAKEGGKTTKTWSQVRLPGQRASTPPPVEEVRRQSQNRMRELLRKGGLSRKTGSDGHKVDR